MLAVHELFEAMAKVDGGNIVSGAIKNAGSNNVEDLEKIEAKLLEPVSSVKKENNEKTLKK